MTKNKLLEILIIIKFVLITSMQIQPTFAMEKEVGIPNFINRGLGFIYSFRAALADDTQRKMDLEQHLDVNLAKALSRFRLPVPQEYVDIMSQGREEVGFNLVAALFYQLYDFQMDEIRHLSNLLWYRSDNVYPRKESILIDKVSRNVKNDCFKSISSLEKVDVGLDQSLDSYVKNEFALNVINTRIIKECLAFIKIDQDSHQAQILLGLCLTRLPTTGIEIIGNWLKDNDHRINGVVIDLSHNNLRWVPDELFSLKKVQVMNLSNNQLYYLPSKIENWRDDLTSLSLGNNKAFFPMFTKRDFCRTTGNIFREIPQPIFKLSKLRVLDLVSVELEYFPKETIYNTFSSLQHMNVACNNLSTVLIESLQNVEGREIVVESYGNPGSPPVPAWQEVSDNFYDICYRYCDLPIFLLEVMIKNPVC